MQIRNIKSNQFSLAIILITIIFFSLCYFLITQIFIYCDVSWHVVAAKRMLANGNYFTNIIDDSFPTVFAFFLPLALLCKNAIFANFHFIFLYILLWYLIASYFVYKVLSSKSIDNYSFFIWYFAYLTWVLFLGVLIIGQRENIMMCLFAPYLFMNLIEGGRLSKPNQAMIAILAAIGIMQVPFYLLLPIVIDSIDCLRRRSKPYFYQTIFYFLSALIFVIAITKYPYYFHHLLGMLAYFQAGTNSSYQQMVYSVFFYVTLIGFVIGVIFNVCFYREEKILKILAMLMLSILIYFLEHKNWFYHLYPSLALCILLLASIHVQNRKDRKKSNSLAVTIKKSLVFVFAYTLLICFFCIGNSYITNYIGYNSKNLPINKLIFFAKKIHSSNNAILLFNYHTRLYWLPVYTDVNVISPWSNMWMYLTLIENKNKPEKIKYYAAVKSIFFKSSLLALTEKKPTYIIVNDYIGYNCIAYLKQDPRIAKQFASYEHYQTIGRYVIFKRDDQ